MDRRDFIKQSLIAGLGSFLLTQLPFLNKLEAKNTINKIMQNEEQLAKYWENINDTTVRCLLCPNFCVIQDGQVGICKDRKNINGKLYSLSYGRIVALNIDPIEKNLYTISYLCLLYYLLAQQVAIFHVKIAKIGI